MSSHKPFGWKSKIGQILSQSKNIRVNGKKASDRTIEMTYQVMTSSIRRLRELGYKIENPVNLNQKHLTVLVQHWYYERRKAMKTIVNELSRIRQFMRIAGKPGHVKHISVYLPDVPKEELVIRTTARYNKSWAAANIDMVEIFAKVDAYDKKLGLMLRLELALGLRRIEVLKCNPHHQDRVHSFEIPPGHAKGGRPRLIPIDTVSKRELLDFVKKNSPRNQYLGWEYNRKGSTASLKQNISRYQKAMSRLGFTKKKLGVTGHGLRAQFAENSLVGKGIVPATLNGQKNQVESGHLTSMRVQVSQELGHHRSQITSAYFGTLKELPDKTQKERMVMLIQQATGNLASADPVPAERLDDCCQVVRELALHEIDITPAKAYALLSEWSRRCGIPWMAPDPGNILKIMEAAANTMIIKQERQVADTEKVE